MEAFSFVHAADLHLDTPFTGVRSTSEHLAQRLRDASLSALDHLVQRALSINAAFVLFAGDLHDGIERGPRAQLRFRAALGRLDQAGIQSFVAHGNHDPAEGRWSAIRDWPDSTTVFRPGTVTSVPVSRGGHHLCTVHGISYGQRHEADNLALCFARPTSPGLHVGVLHCNAGGFQEHAPYSPCSVSDLVGRGLDYWALGHVHTHRRLHDSPWIVYPGATQGRSFARHEQGPKGAVEVHVRDGQIADVAWFSTDEVRFFDVEIDIGRFQSLPELEEAIQLRGTVLHERNPGVLLLLRLCLTGRGEVRNDFSEPKRREELLEALRESTGMAWLGIRDQTRLPINLEEVRAGEDLRAAVLDTWTSWESIESWPSGLRDDLSRVLALDAIAQPAELAEDALYDVLERLSQS